MDPQVIESGHSYTVFRPGTGKTSLIQALARVRVSNGLHSVSDSSRSSAATHGARSNRHKSIRLESSRFQLNASDDRGIAVVRNQIKTFAESQAPVFSAAELPVLVPTLKDENMPKSNATKAQPR